MVPAPISKVVQERALVVHALDGRELQERVQPKPVQAPADLGKGRVRKW